MQKLDIGHDRPVIPKKTGQLCPIVSQRPGLREHEPVVVEVLSLTMRSALPAAIAARRTWSISLDQVPLQIEPHFPPKMKSIWVYCLWIFFESWTPVKSVKVALLPDTRLGGAVVIRLWKAKPFCLIG